VRRTVDSSKFGAASRGRAIGTTERVMAILGLIDGEIARTSA
jgi:hypothetical protein